MTVGELRALLAQYPADLRIVIDGYEGGIEDVAADRLVPATLYLDVNRPGNPFANQWRGPHELLHRIDLADDERPPEQADALIISRHAAEYYE